MRLNHKILLLFILITIVFVVGCTSTSNSAFEIYRSQAKPDTYTGICNLNDKCVTLQRNCADAFQNHDAGIIYSQIEADLTISSYKGNSCQDWKDWVITASDLSSQQPTEWIWQWALDTGLINSPDQQSKCGECQHDDCLDSTTPRTCLDAGGVCPTWHIGKCVSGTTCRMETTNGQTYAICR